jgi:phosphoglycolate phosphatase
MTTMTLFFDLDGTLVDSLPDLTAAVNAARLHFSLCPVSAEQTTTYIGDGQLNLVKRAFADAPQVLDLQQPLQVLREYYKNHLLDQTRLFPGVAETLRLLKATCKLGVVTNKPQAEAEQICDGLGISAFLACIIGGGRTVNLKPHPEPLLLAMRIADAKTEKSWMIGDHHTDLDAAAAAGCKSCFCTYGYGQIKQQKPDREIDSFSDLPKIIGIH